MRMSTVNHQYLDHVILMSIERIQTWVTAETVQLRPQDPAHFATYLPSHSPKDLLWQFHGNMMMQQWIWDILGYLDHLRGLGVARGHCKPSVLGTSKKPKCYLWIDSSTHSTHMVVPLSLRPATCIFSLPQIQTKTGLRFGADKRNVEDAPIVRFCFWEDLCNSTEPGNLPFQRFFTWFIIVSTA